MPWASPLGAVTAGKRYRLAPTGVYRSNILGKLWMDFPPQACPGLTMFHGTFNCFSNVLTIDMCDSDKQTCALLFGCLLTCLLRLEIHKGEREEVLHSFSVRTQRGNGGGCMPDLCDVYTRARLLIRLSDNKPTPHPRPLDCAPPSSPYLVPSPLLLFESETSVCTLVPANPEYYANQQQTSYTISRSISPTISFSNVWRIGCCCASNSGLSQKQKT
ncbi:hypothetical protein M0802_006595 [Mischocyttarus mexicanus]|nr:hypothetical protein M0802_006595 [Mischocyttarus mexicanus]